MHKITLPKFFLFLDHYENNIVQNDITNLGIIYRNYSKKQNLKDIEKIRLYCKKKRYKFYISNSLKLAKKFRADGLYIPAFNKKLIFKNITVNKKFLLIGSAHNQMEIVLKLAQGCRAIFLSPLFQNKKKKNNLGICRFNIAKLNHKTKFVALGGVSEKNLRSIKMLNVYGIAGISYLKKKTGLNFRPVF